MGGNRRTGERKEPEGVSIKVNKSFHLRFPKLSLRTKRLLWRWTQGVLATLLTAGSVSNYVEIKWTKRATTTNEASVTIIQDKLSDYDAMKEKVAACEKVNMENSSLKVTLGDLVDALEAFTKNPRSWKAKQQLDGAVLKAKTQLGKPISQDTTTADKSLPAATSAPVRNFNE